MSHQLIFHCKAFICPEIVIGCHSGTDWAMHVSDYAVSVRLVYSKQTDFAIIMNTAVMIAKQSDEP